MTPETLHHVFVPFTDVYALGGPHSFNHLESKGEKEPPNVVVIPYEFVRRLEIESEHSTGARETLREIVRMTGERTPESSGESEYRTVQVNGGLTLAILDPVNDGTKYDIGALDERVEKLFGRKPTMLTSTPRHLIRHRGGGIHIDSPHFLQVHRDIVKEGIIEGDEDLLAALHQSQGNLTIEQAAKFGLNGAADGLSVNQFMRFSHGEKKEFARIVGNLERNVAGSRIVGVEDLRLVLLEQREYEKAIQVGNMRMHDVLGIRPRDMEQYLALQYGLFNPNVDITFLCGSQGSGKTLLAYAAAVDQVLHYNKDARMRRGMTGEPNEGGFFHHIVLLKPTDILGGSRRDVGALPGNLYEKIEPHLAPYIDAHRETVLNELCDFEEMILDKRRKNKFGPPRDPSVAEKRIQGCANLPPQAVVEVTYTGFMRGRSFTNTLLLVDEAQNLTPYELRTVLERLGEGSKAIVMGDPYQIDNPLCTDEINGLTAAVAHFKDKAYSSLLWLSKNYRSQVSEDTRGMPAFR